MDQKTLAAYDASAVAFAEDWHTQPAPTDLHALVRRFFRPGPVADIGCGSGREVAWLAANGWRASGYDASDGLIAQARGRYPALSFERAALPELSPIAEASFDNVLCETVIMHLPVAQVAPSVRRLLAILKPGGVLYLSWRVTAGQDQRDRQGRLYTAFPADLVRGTMVGTSTLHDEEVASISSGRIIHRIVARKHEGA